jgi:hypothetical protein
MKLINAKRRDATVKADGIQPAATTRLQRVNAINPTAG